MTVPQADALGDAGHRLEVAHLSKTFGSARVLRNIGLQIAPGELHGLVGQNGCGKSTLVKILTGIYTPDPAGPSRWTGGRSRCRSGRWTPARRVWRSSTRTSAWWTTGRSGRTCGSAATRRPAGSPGGSTAGRSGQPSRRSSARLGAHVDVNEQVGELSAEDRAAVAIARAMQDHQPGGGLIIFDESTRALTKSARGRFFELVRGVIDGGASVLMISHQLEEIVEVTDRVTVLRDGQVVEAGIPTKDTDEAGLTRLMLGRHLVAHSRVDSHAHRRLGGRGRQLTVRSVEGFDLDLKKGEIVGLTGLVGSGAVAVAEAVGGAREARAGTLTVAGKEISLKQHRGSTEEFIAAGVAFVAEAPPRAGSRGGDVRGRQPDAAPGPQPRRAAAHRRPRGRRRRPPP